MTQDDIGAATRRFANVWTRYGNVAGGGDWSEDAVIWRRWGDNPFTTWNCVFVAPDAVTPDAVKYSLETAAEYLRQQSRQGIIVVAEERLKSLSGQVDGLGLAKLTVMVEMYGTVSRMTLPSSSTLRIERVVSMPLLETYSDINALAFGLPQETVRAGIAVAPGTMMLDAYSFIGYQDDEAVAVASVLPHEDRLYLGLVATIPSAQRRGFASQVLGHALQNANVATGIDHADLHATVAGAPVYEKLGYSKAVPFTLLGLSS